MRKNRIVVIALAVLMVFAAVSCEEEPVVETHVHEWDEGTPTKEATCIEAGERVYKCKGEGCLETKLEVIPALGHAFGDDGKCSRCEATEKSVARIGVKYFDALASAIDSITDDTVATTIVMIKDVDNAAGISVKSGRNIIVDFDGHKYLAEQPGAGSTGTQTQAFQLLKGSTVVFKNGTIGCTEANKTYTGERPILMIIQNYCNLTLDNMAIDGTNMAHSAGNPVSYAVSVNCGDVSFKDTKITVIDGDVAFDSCEFSSYAIPTVTVSGASEINGKIELSGGTLVCPEVLKSKISYCAGFEEKYNMTIESGILTAEMK